MNPGCHAPGIEGAEPLRHKPDGQTGEDVAGPGGRQGGRRAGVDDGAAVRMGYHGVGALQQHHSAAFRRRRPRPGQTVAIPGEQALEFAVVGCQQASVRIALRE